MLFGHKIYLQYEDWENREIILNKLLEGYDFYNHVDGEKMYCHGKYGNPISVDINHDAQWVELTFDSIFQVEEFIEIYNEL